MKSVVAIVLACIAFHGSATAQVRVVARQGVPAPGVTATFSGFSAPVINSGGLVAFGASADRGGFDFLRGLWSEGDGLGSLRAVALQGDSAPTPGALSFTGFVDPERSLLLNDLGDVAFLGEVSGSLVGIYTDRERLVGPALLEVARESLPAADTDAGRTYNGIDLLGMGRIHSGVTFRALLAPGDAPANFPGEAAYNESFAVVLTNVAQTADSATGTSRPGFGAALFTEFRAPTINDAGRVAFSASTNAGASFGSIGAEGVWTTSPDGSLRAVALAGQPAPGAPSTFSTVFGRLGTQQDTTAVINDDGDIAFTATLTGLIAGGLRVGVWVERDGVVEKVAFESEAAPGTATSFSVLDDPLIDAAGLATFAATLADGRDGLWRETSPGLIAPLAIEGDAAPGSGGLSYRNVTDVAVSRPGRVAFRAQLSDLASQALFATDSTGVVQRVVGRGDIIDLDGTPFRVQDVSFNGVTGSIAGSGGGVGSGLSDSGTLAAAVFGEALGDDLTPTGNFFQAIVVFDAPVPTLPGDYNADGLVNAADYTVWRDSVGSVENLAADGDSSGTIDAADRGVWAANYGAVAPSTAAAVPEPASIGFGALLLLARALIPR